MSSIFTRPPLQRVLAGACTALLLTSTTVSPASAQNRLPSLGDSVSEDFDIGFERSLGDEIMRDIRRDPDYLDDPILLDHVNAIWRPLVEAARRRGEIGPDLDQRFAWQVFLVRDRSVNAFALPGGHVGVHLGLIAMTATPDELASVLAHELTHVTQRHIARGVSNSRRQSLIGAAAMILGVLAASRSNRGDAANAVIAGGQAASIQGQLNFSRDMEREADRIGYGVMNGAGFAGAGMAAMFEKLEQASRLNDSGSFPYLRSHPLTSERIGAARARLGTGDGSRSAGAPVSRIAHVLAQARARVLMDGRVAALRRWQSSEPEAGPRGGRAADPLDALGAAVSAALASTLLQDWERADLALAQATALLRPLPADERSWAEPALAMLGAQSRLARGDAAGAASLLAAVPALREPASRAALLLSTQVAIAAPAAGDETLRMRSAKLQTWVAEHPQDAPAWLALSQVWTRLGQPLRSIRAEAEARHALGDLTGAIDRLRAGQGLVRSGGATDFIEASVIDSRLRDIEAERRREQIEREQRRGG